MEPLIKELSLDLTTRLLNAEKITLEDLGKQEDWEYPNNTDTLCISKDELKKEEVELLRKHNLISEYLKWKWDPRSVVWIINPEKIQVIKDVDFHYRVERSYKLIKEQEKNDSKE
jgi:hypothetical protein